MTLLEIRGLTRNFGGIRALDGVDLDVGKGDLVGLIGPNGSGKTTVFNVITGIYRPDAGSIRLEGREISGMPSHGISRLGIARTFQNIRLFRNLTVQDNVRAAAHQRVPYGPLAAIARLPGYNRGEREIRDRANDILSLCGLAGRRHDAAGDLSYGDQRRLEIARALASEPRVLLLDEPAAGMNPNEVGKLGEFILDIRERFRLTVLLIEHQMRLVMGICGSIVVMDFGQVIARGNPSEIRRNPSVVEAYLGEEIP